MDGVHELNGVVQESDPDVLFACTLCGARIGFNKPGIGEPHAVPVDGGGWLPHPDFNNWMDRCTGA